MKRWFALLLALLMVAGCMTACGNKQDSADDEIQYDANGNWNSADSIYKANGDTTLYAGWKKQASVVLEIFINGKKVNIKTPEQAVKNGICYLSEDRKRYGLMLQKSVTENSTIASVDDFITAGLINDGKMKAASAEFNEFIIS